MGLFASAASPKRVLCSVSRRRDGHPVSNSPVLDPVGRDPRCFESGPAAESPPLRGDFVHHTAPIGAPAITSRRDDGGGQPR